MSNKKCGMADLHIVQQTLHQPISIKHTVVQHNLVYNWLLAYDSWHGQHTQQHNISKRSGQEPITTSCI